MTPALPIERSQFWLRRNPRCSLPEARRALSDFAGQKTLLTGPARTGKSTFLRLRLGRLLLEGAPGNQITVVTVNRSVAKQMRQYVDSLDLPAGATPRFDTYFGIAGATVARYWPRVRDLIAPSRRRLYPVPLANDLAQYHLRQIVESTMRNRGYFRGLRIRPERIVAQLLDTAHSAALNDRSLSDAIDRLKATWTGQQIRLEHFDQAHATLEEYRQFCAKNGLIDVSLLVEYFRHVLKSEKTALASQRNRARYLLADNLEEHPHVSQQFLVDLAEHSDEALFVVDEQAGFRQFLGAYPAGVDKLIPRLDRQIQRTAESSVDQAIADILLGSEATGRSTPPSDKNFEVWLSRTRIGMIDLVVERTNAIVNGPDGGGQRVCLLSPYVDGLLALLVKDGLSKNGIPLQVRQPGEALIDRPCVRAFHAVAGLLHPRWASPVRYDDLRLALMVFLNLDAVTASLLLDRSGFKSNGSLARISESRIVEEVGEESVAQYNFLQRWSAAYQTGEELSVDLFVRRLFGEVVARSYQPLRTPSDVAADFSRLQHAARRFVELGPEVFAGGSPASGARFLEMLSMRVTPAKADDDPSLSPGVVYLMPVHTFLTGDLTCDYQFWLDAGSPAWWEPPARPLANSRILLQDWPYDRVWDVRAKSSAQTAALARVVQGLAARARNGVSIIGCEEGGNASGALWRAVTKTIDPIFPEAPVA